MLACGLATHFVPAEVLILSDFVICLRDCCSKVQIMYKNYSSLGLGINIVLSVAYLHHFVTLRDLRCILWLFNSGEIYFYSNETAPWCVSSCSYDSSGSFSSFRKGIEVLDSKK